MDKFKIFLLDGRGNWENNPYVPSIRTFPGGEQWVKLPTFDRDVQHARIEAILISSADVMTLVMLVDALRRAGIPNLRLTMPYIPYARQDRVCNEGESLSISAFANIINSLEFSSVVVYDAHSEVAPAVIERCINVPRYELMLKHEGVMKLLADNPGNVWLVSPDAGAVKKSYDTIKHFNAHSSYSQFNGIIFAEKVRDVATGNITKTTFVPPCTDDGESLVDGAHLLIADDICDGGRTFLELAKVIGLYAPASVSLYVTHGIFSAGLHVLEKRMVFPKNDPSKVFNDGGPFDNVWSTINFQDYS